MTTKSAGKSPARPKPKPKDRKARQSSVGASAIAGLKEALAHAKGETVPGIVVWQPVDVAAIRKRTGLSQDKFAAKFGLDASAVRAWEQHTRTPERAAQILLRVIDSNPEVVEAVLKRA